MPDRENSSHLGGAYGADRKVGDCAPIHSLLTSNTSTTDVGISKYLIGHSGRRRFSGVGLLSERWVGMLAAGSKQFLPNTVMYTLATAGYVPFTLNLHASMKRVGLAEHLVVYTPDEAVQRELLAFGLRSLAFGSEMLPNWGEWSTHEFARIVSLKFAIAIEILMSGSNALFVDGDIVFLKNPMIYLQQVIDQSRAQMVMQYESPKEVYNTGFWFARPHPAVIQMFHDIRANLVDKTYCDQTCLNELARLSGSIEIEALDAELFACGNQFLGKLSNAAETIDQSVRPFDFKSAYLLHFNYLVGKPSKINAIKECKSLFYPGLLQEHD